MGESRTFFHWGGGSEGYLILAGGGSVRGIFSVNLLFKFKKYLTFFRASGPTKEDPRASLYNFYQANG